MSEAAHIEDAGTIAGPPLQVGILGAGQAGQRHTVGFAAVPGVQIAAVADLDRQRAEQLAQTVNAAAYTDWRPMLDAGLDILVVATPHTLHVAPAIAAAQAGVHLMVEKPLATTVGDAQSIVEACAAHGVKLSTSFVHRYRDEAQSLLQWVRAGELGQLRLARETMSIERTNAVPGWVMTRELGGGGVIMYSAIHGIDRLRWLLGSEVVRVDASICSLTPPRADSPDAGISQGDSSEGNLPKTGTPEVEDGVSAHLTFVNGASATLSASAPPYPAQPTIWETELLGDLGMGRLRTRAWAQLSNAQGQRHVDVTQVPHRLGEHYNFIRQAQAFVRAIRQNTEPPVTGLDGLAAVEIVTMIYASAAKGTPVERTFLEQTRAGKPPDTAQSTG